MDEGVEGKIGPGNSFQDVVHKIFKRSREGLKQLAQDLSHSCHSARSAASKRGAETKKVLKGMCAAEDERVLLVWKAYCLDDDGTQTWSASCNPSRSSSFLFVLLGDG
jgi:hypothetical protein